MGWLHPHKDISQTVYKLLAACGHFTSFTSPPPPPSVEYGRGGNGRGRGGYGGDASITDMFGGYHDHLLAMNWNASMIITPSQQLLASSFWMFWIEGSQQHLGLQPLSFLISSTPILVNEAPVLMAQVVRMPAPIWTCKWSSRVQLFRDWVTCGSGHSCCLLFPCCKHLQPWAPLSAARRLRILLNASACRTLGRDHWRPRVKGTFCSCHMKLRL